MGTHAQASVPERSQQGIGIEEYIRASGEPTRIAFRTPEGCYVRIASPVGKPDVTGPLRVDLVSLADEGSPTVPLFQSPCVALPMSWSLAERYAVEGAIGTSRGSKCACIRLRRPKESVVSLLVCPVAKMSEFWRKHTPPILFLCSHNAASTS